MRIFDLFESGNCEGEMSSNIYEKKIIIWCGRGIVPSTFNDNMKIIMEEWWRFFGELFIFHVADTK